MRNPPALPQPGQTFDTGSGPDTLRHVCKARCAAGVETSCGQQVAQEALTPKSAYGREGTPPQLAVPLCQRCHEELRGGRP
jgi:hypothetical protein